MKLFHTKNGKQSVYVQLKDIKYLKDSDSIPDEISTVVLSVFNDFDVDASTKFNFVRFDEEAVISFFKDLDFIIDYEHYRHFTEEQFNEEKNKLVEKANFFANARRNLSQKCKQDILVKERSNVLHKLDSLQELLKFKHKQLSMPIPKWALKKKSPNSKPKKAN